MTRTIDLISPRTTASGGRSSSRRPARHLAAAVLAGVTFVAGIGAAQAASYPDRAVKFIVPWSPGGGSDTLMRVVSNNIEPYLGEPMPVINMPGVSGTRGRVVKR